MSQPPTPEESRVTELIRSIDVPAPQGLHDRVQALVAERGGPARSRSPRRLALAGATALVVVAVAIAAAVGLGGSGGSGTAGLERQASTFALGQPVAPPPAENPASRGELLASVGGVAFPAWKDGVGWHPTGMRSGSIAGRPAVTVYYGDWRGRQIGYTIVGGEPFSETATTGRSAWRGGTEYRLVSLGGQHAVVWLRSGRLCVLTGRGVAAPTLLRLASHGEQALAA